MIVNITPMTGNEYFTIRAMEFTGYEPNATIYTFNRVYPSPENNVANNTQQTFNFTTTSNSNITLYFDTNTNPTTDVAYRTLTSFLNWTSNVANGTYYYKLLLNHSNGATMTDTFLWVMDNYLPNFTLNPTTSFSAANNSILHDSINLNFSFYDNRKLNSYLINITNNVGITVWNYTVENIFNTSMHHISTIPLFYLNSGAYYVNVRVSDDGSSSRLNTVSTDYAFNVSLYPFNVSVYFANNLIYNTSTFLVDKNISLNTTHINILLNNSCSCVGCIDNGYYCRVPLKVFNNIDSTLNMTILVGNYTYDIDNCTSYKYSAYNFTIKDESTNALVTANTSMTTAFNFVHDLTYNNYGTQNNTFRMCKYPEWLYGTLDMEHTLVANNYYPRTFYKNDAALSSIYYGYMLPTSSTALYVSLKFIDGDTDPIEDATIKIYKNLGGISTLVYEANTNFAGIISTYMDINSIYTITANATGFDFMTFSLQPAASSYTISLTGEPIVFYNPIYEGLRYQFILDGITTPQPPLYFNLTDAVYHNLTFKAEGAGITEIGINLSGHSYACVPANCYNTFSGSGEVSVLIKTNATQSVSSAAWIVKDGVKKYVNDVNIQPALELVGKIYSLFQLGLDMKETMTFKQQTVILGFGMVVVVGISTALGLMGSLLLVPVCLALIIAIFMGLVNPLLGGIIAFTGFLSYVLLEGTKLQ
jgi:hypothetical protein